MLTGQSGNHKVLLATSQDFSGPPAPTKPQVRANRIGQHGLTATVTSVSYTEALTPDSLAKTLRDLPSASPSSFHSLPPSTSPAQHTLSFLSHLGDLVSAVASAGSISPPAFGLIKFFWSQPERELCREPSLRLFVLFFKVFLIFNFFKLLFL